MPDLPVTERTWLKKQTVPKQRFGAASQNKAGGAEVVYAPRPSGRHAKQRRGCTNENAGIVMPARSEPDS